MREELLRIRGCFFVAAALAVLLLAAGCGGSDDAGSVTVGAITVQNGSLSKEEFIEKADEICKAARKEFDADYSKFLSANTSGKQSQATLAKELVESVAVPDLEKEIDEISDLGAPQGYAQEVGAYLNALKARLDEGEKDPLGLISTSSTFKKAATLAKKAGLNGCAASLG